MHFFGPYKSMAYEISRLLFLPFATTSEGRGFSRNMMKTSSRSSYLIMGRHPQQAVMRLYDSHAHASTPMTQNRF